MVPAGRLKVVSPLRRLAGCVTSSQGRLHTEVVVA